MDEFTAAFHEAIEEYLEFCTNRSETTDMPSQIPFDALYVYSRGFVLLPVITLSFQQVFYLRSDLSEKNFP